MTTAIIFHQLFEGLSLGIRIAALPPKHNPKPQMRGRLESRDSTDEHPSLVNGKVATQDNSTVPSTSVSPSHDRRHERRATTVSCHALANLPHPPPSIPPQPINPLGPSDTVECGSPNHKHSSRWKICFVSCFNVRRWRISRGNWGEVHWLKPTLSLLFAVTTPFGIGLGMAVWGDRDKDTSNRGMSVI